MKKTITVLAAALLLLQACSFNPTNVRGTHISNRMEDSTVLIKMKLHMTKINLETGEKKEKSGWGSCSGVYITDNVILSAAHCVSFNEDDEKGLELKEIWIKHGNDSERAVVVKVDPAADLLLLYTPLKGTPIRLAARAVRGQDCWVIGNPLGIQDILTRGIVSKIDWVIKEEKARFIVLDAAVLPGNSGGAVVDSNCHLIGILTRSTSMFGAAGATGLGMAVDLKTIRIFLKDIK
jgi:S1-C subfamily serine protease